MGRGDGQGVVADQIAVGAEDLGLGLGVAGDLRVVLGVAGVAEENDAGDLGLLGRGEALDGVVHDGAALAVAADEDGRVGALGHGHLDDLGGAGDGLLVRVLGLEVGRERCRVAVLGANALAGDLVGSQLLLEAGAGWWAGDLTLLTKCVSSMSFCLIDKYIYIYI